MRTAHIRHGNSRNRRRNARASSQAGTNASAGIVVNAAAGSPGAAAVANTRRAKIDRHAIVDRDAKARVHQLIEPRPERVPLFQRGAGLQLEIALGQLALQCRLRQTAKARKLH